MKVLITGVAGFIGYHLAKKLIASEYDVDGIDNLNNYYDQRIKLARIEDIRAIGGNFQFKEVDIAHKESLGKIFQESEYDVVINLAAQAGVRYSIENPSAYVESNLVGFVNILEECRGNKIKHLVYASSSSVYGLSEKQPFNVNQNVDYPISLYAATKKSNELMAHTYSHLFSLPTTGLRFFTVYGPYGRPDMAYYKFTKSILSGEPIEVYNHGEMKRDFTYIDDIVDGIIRVIHKIPGSISNKDAYTHAPYKIYNIGNNKPVSLGRFIEVIEKECGRKAIKINMPMQPGDVETTYADIDELISDTGFEPKVQIEEGIKKFVEWYKKYYGL
ncbi:UDP-glucuronate 4-epimerase [Limnobacter thiooxidans]|uniref:NAD-dependent epimerase n=1 Tax=Limnobacter thiooxidans TaxID=131080 RepID=A0AA86M7Y1_9BURK|nr:NAD-dependent epimerase [Limnobacter sp.]MCZ8017062.1 NAD-dependent epimerase [Limnobacter sp.]RZS38782.1 UDP-glucuronate 4-epimerase [Limnobacter thiooxidans]BET24764.1 NAD-dependent epimerase [Limnobacter thiooxidans]